MQQKRQKMRITAELNRSQKRRGQLRPLSGAVVEREGDDHLNWAEHPRHFLLEVAPRPHDVPKHLRPARTMLRFIIRGNEESTQSPRDAAAANCRGMNTAAAAAAGIHSFIQSPPGCGARLGQPLLVDVVVQTEASRPAAAAAAAANAAAAAAAAQQMHRPTV